MKRIKKSSGVGSGSARQTNNQPQEIEIEQSIEKKPHLLHLGLKIIFWFAVGMLVGLVLVVSLLFFFFQKYYDGKIYPGVMINGINFGGKTQSQVSNYFWEKNQIINKNTFTFSGGGNVATISAKALNIGYDPNLLAIQAYSLGRSPDTLSNISIILQSYTNGVQLNENYSYDQTKVATILAPIVQKVYVAPVDALFQFDNGRVTQFQPSSDGQQVDMPKIQNQVKTDVAVIAGGNVSKNFPISIPIVALKSNLTTDKVNNLGIKELIGSGTSLFEGSAAERIYNVELGASRTNGVIVKPGEVFSFDNTIGDVSALTGYKQAYVISGGHTVLGDGGGICQVSTTLFRAALNAGLPIVERHAHDYRVHYYEEDGPPGIDATIYTPSVDLKFKNDTGNSILIESVVDPSNLRLTFNIYGTSDGRTVSMTTPVVSNIIPAPPALYNDDPTLPVGTIKQTDFSADGATVVFSRTVTRNNQTIINDTYTSVYRPWQAVFQRGTKT